MQAGLRKKIINAVKLSASYMFDEAIDLLNEYIQVANQEILHAREAANLSKELFKESSKARKLYKRNQAAKELGLTIDTIRNWEMNGLITVRRKENGYRIYDENDMKCLRIIRSLRCANYSLSAILRMMIKLKSNQKDAGDIYDILNTPDEGDSIVSACDKLAVSLQNAIENASVAKEIIYEIKIINNTNPPL